MDFKNIPYITIPEGPVKSIKVGSTQIWERAHIYGVNWAGGTAATMTRTDDASSFSAPKIGTGTTKGSSSFDNCYPWKDMSVETISGNVLVKIPKFWFKWTKSGTTMKLQIADKPVNGFLVSPMHQDRGDGKGERDYAYIGRHKCNSSYKSVSGQSPIFSKTIDACRTGIKNLGTGFYQEDYAAFWTIRMLALVEFATWNLPSVLLSTTNYDTVANIKTGNVTAMTYHTGVSANKYSFQYRYIEDLWINGLEWLDGLYYSGTSVYCINNPTKFAVGSNGTKIGTRPTTTGFISSWTIPTSSNFKWALIPAATTTNESYTYDGYYYQSTGTVAYIGGARTLLPVHGPFFLYTDFTNTSTSTVITSRLMYLP